MQFTEIDPSPEFKPFIEKYLYCSTGENFFPYWFKAVPNGFTELFFNIQGSEFIIQSQRYCLENPKAFIVGVHDIYADSFIKNNSPMRSFIVNFKVSGYRCFFNIDESVLVNQIFDAEPILGMAVRKTWNRLNKSSSPEEMKVAFEHYFYFFLNKSYQIDESIDKFIQMLWEHNGFQSVKDICRLSNIPERKLERVFKEHTGLTPQKYLQIIRINNLFRLSLNYSKLIELAIESGYYDQAHFIRDFKRITLLAPKTFFKNDGAMFYDKSTTNRIYIPVDETKILELVQKNRKNDKNPVVAINNL